MRRRFTLRGLLAVVPFVLALAAPALAPAQVALQDSVIGQGGTYAEAEDSGVIVGVTATSDALGRATGEASLHIVEFGRDVGRYAGPVTCLSVSGNRAVVGVAVEDADPSTGAPAGFFAVVVDGGVGGVPEFDYLGAIATADAGLGLGDVIPSDCSRTPPNVSLQPVDFGREFEVVDAPPLYKDLCKNGGWRNYGTTFKNQGQCVAFVQRGPKA